MLCKKGIPRNFVKFTGKHLCQENTRPQPACKFIKKEALAQLFSCEFYKIFNNTFFNRTPLVAASVLLHTKVFHDVIRFEILKLKNLHIARTKKTSKIKLEAFFLVSKVLDLKNKIVKYVEHNH